MSSKSKIRSVIKGTSRWAIVLGSSPKPLKYVKDNTIDSLVTDPPAGIAFMGKEWDRPDGISGSFGQDVSDTISARNAFVSSLTSILKEAFRVLKPGGHALIWALPRTSHWTGLAVEDAGFEIRDAVQHVFGCLSSDTEVIADGKWIPYTQVQIGQNALCFDLKTGTYRWDTINEVLTYDYCDTAFRIVSDSTDQIVSKNHRCIVEQDGETVFRLAESLARERQARVPVLEDLQGLLKTLPMPHKGTGSTQALLREEVPVHLSKTKSVSEKTSPSLRNLQEKVQSSRGPGNRKTAQTEGSGTSQTPRSLTQLQEQSNAVPIQLGSQEVRSTRFTKTTVARIEPIYYEGKVWCLRVPTGAFVARRNGKVFVTGNNGFPKSMNIGKAIDKVKCKKRKVIGVDPERAGRLVNQTGKYRTKSGWSAGNRSANITAPASREAALFDGWGTALKPASEVWILARKPLDGTVAKNVLEWGTGGINIDGCRISTQDNLNGGAYSGGERPKSAMGLKGEAGGTSSMLEEGGGRLDPSKYKQPSGRWPANFLLSHHPDCELVGVKKVKAKQLTAGKRTVKWGVGEGGCSYKKGTGAKFATPDGKDVAPIWNCVEGCPVRMMDEQSGCLKSGAMQLGQPRKKSKGKGGYHGGMPDTASTVSYLGDSGGASRFFYQAKPSTREKNAGCKGLFWREKKGHLIRISKKKYKKLKKAGEKVLRGNVHPTIKGVQLMRYLCRMITPLGGVVLDMFNGSGTTGCAAVQEGFRYIGIEREKAYKVIASKRIRHILREVKAEEREAKKAPKPLFEG